MEAQKFELEKKREEREEKLAAFGTWDGKNAELEYKINLVKRYKEMGELNWSDEQILSLFPAMEQVIQSSNNNKEYR